MTDDKHVDESWKKQAQAEKEKLDAASKPSGPPPAQKESEAPPSGPADFPALVASLASGALLALGVLPDAEGKTPPPDFERARFAIDLLDMLAEKTKGNLTPEEERHLTGALHELHLAYVEATRRGPKP
ncbi:MAG TPA: DUF1844 domain-containing protein [Planctomycetota bacterium]|jgi:hypothetical protein